MELRDYARFLQLYWRMIALAILLATGLSLAYSYTLSSPPTYEATTRLFVSGAAPNQRDIASVGQYSSQLIQSYVELVSGDEIARRVVQRLDLSETPRQLASQTSATATPNTVILQISVASSSAGRAQLLANAVAKEFVAFVRETETPPGKTQPNIRAIIIDTAAKPTTAIGGPQPRRSLGLGLVLGSLIGFGIAVVRESLKPEDAAD